MSTSPQTHSFSTFNDSMTRLLSQDRRPIDFASQPAVEILISRLQSRTYQKHPLHPTFLEGSLTDLNAVFSIAYELCYLREDDLILRRAEIQIDALKERLSHAEHCFVSGKGYRFQFEKEALLHADELIQLLFAYHEKTQHVLM